MESQIDQRMKAEGFNANGNFAIYAGPLEEKVINELIRRYKGAGWKEVEYFAPRKGLIFRK